MGKAISVGLAEAGNNVFATYFKTPVQENLPGLNYHYLDLSDNNIDLDFLPESLNGLVFCPGSIRLKPFKRIKPEEFMEDFNLYVVGAIKIIQLVLNRLKAASNASIVLISTVAVQTGFHFHSIVSTTKGAIEGLSRALAAELAPGIRLNCIAPSITDTPMTENLLNSETKREANANRHPLKRIGEVNDIAEMAMFLLSEKSGWITGQILHVDGGISSIKS